MEWLVDSIALQELNVLTHKSASRFSTSVRPGDLSHPKGRRCKLVLLTLH